MTLGHYDGAATAASASMVALSQESEVHDWTHALDVAAALLQPAIASGGPEAMGVRVHLLQMRPTWRNAADARPDLAESAPTAEPVPWTG